MAKLQSDRYERVYFQKIQMEYYCLGQNHASGTLISSLFGVKVHTSCKKIYVLGGQKPTWANFLEFRFFFTPEKSRLYRYYQNKNQLGFTSSSYINLTLKLLRKSKNSPKTRVKMKFQIFGKPYLSFASYRLFIFSGFIVHQGMMQIN